jgi:hypothetical protein
VSNLCCGLAPTDSVFAPSTAAPAPPVGAGPAGERGSGASEGATIEYLIRGMSLNGAAQLVVGDTMRVGQRFRFMVRDAEGARADLEAHGVAYKRRQLAAVLAGRPEPPPLGALLFSCNGRGSGLYGEESYDARQVGAYVGVPICGFQCNGGFPRGMGRGGAGLGDPGLQGAGMARMRLCCSAGPLLRRRLTQPPRAHTAAGEIGSVGGSTKLHGFTAAIAILRPGWPSGRGGTSGTDGSTPAGL